MSYHKNKQENNGTRIISMKRKNLGVPTETHMKIERVAVEVTARTGRVTKWTDVVNYMINNYLNDAKHDLINRVEQEKLEREIIEGKIT